MFFIGPLEAASQEAFYGKARDVSKLLNSSGLMAHSATLFFHWWVERNLIFFIQQE